ncbi:MAG: hypothetical protein KF777_00210 [Planctomycetaceae bacterium]|nr:hypothetical protein [Planctomycetaceae bacterium]
MTFLQKGIDMAMNLRRAIFGVPPDDRSTAGTNATAAHQASEQPRYLPASQLTEQQIEGVGVAGDCWVPWRVDGGGERWYQRVSDDTATQPVAIRGFAAEPSEDEDDEDSEDDDDDDSAEPPETLTREELEGIAAKLTGHPAYVLTASDGFQFGSEMTGGMYGQVLDMLAQDELQAAGRWDGRRPAFYVDDLDPGDRSTTLAILCHELAHYAEWGFDHEQAAEDVPVERVERERQTIARSAENPRVPMEYDPLHSVKFARAAIHYWKRLLALHPEFWFPSGMLWQAEWYGAPTPFKVLMALGDEPARLAPLFVSTIVDLPAPAAFDELFTR